MRNTIGANPVSSSKYLSRFTSGEVLGFSRQRDEFDPRTRLRIITYPNDVMCELCDEKETLSGCAVLQRWFGYEDGTSLKTAKCVLRWSGDIAGLKFQRGSLETSRTHNDA